MLGIKYKLKVINPTDAAEREGLLKVNPHGQIPVLVEGDWYLSETNAILKYLVSIVSDTKGLYPKDDERAAAKMESLLSYDVESFRPKCNSFYQEQVIGRAHGQREKPSEEEKKEWQEELDEGFALLDDWLQETEGPYLDGDKLTLVDLTVFFSLLTIIHFGKGKYDSFDRVKEWYDRVYDEKHVKGIMDIAKVEIQKFSDEIGFDP